MKLLIFLLQIGELVKGNFNWRGFIQLVIFILMGLVVVSFGGFIVYKVLKTAKKRKDEDGI